MIASFLPLSLGALGSTPSETRPPTGAPGGEPKTAGAEGPAAGADDLIDLVRAVGARLSARDRRGAAGHGLTAAQRTLLAELVRCGPATLPQLARARSVTRQQVRVVVEGLTERGLVHRVPNPAHRRSYLVGVTSGGAALAREIRRGESLLVSRVEREVGTDALHDARCGLRAVLRALESAER